MPEVRFSIRCCIFRWGNLGHHSHVALKECKPIAEPVACTQTASLRLLDDRMSISQAIQSHVVPHESGIRQKLTWIKAVSLAEFLRRLLPSSESAVFES